MILHRGEPSRERWRIFILEEIDTGDAERFIAESSRRERDEEISSAISSRRRRGEQERRGEIIVDFVEEASRRGRETRRDHRRFRRGGVEERERDKERSSPIDPVGVEETSRRRRGGVDFVEREDDIGGVVEREN